MKRVNFLFGLILTVFFLSASAIFAGDWVSVNEAAHLLGLSVVRDIQGGRVFLQGRGRTLTLAAGMDRVLLDGEQYRIPRPVRYHRSALELPRKTLDALIEMLRVDPVRAEQPGAPLVFPESLPLEGLFWKVVLDPGHGGPFRGTMGKSGLKEKSVNLDIAKRIARFLESKGVQVILTRTTDTCLDNNLKKDLSLRAELANRSNADIFVSIHANHVSKPSIKGMEFYVVNSGRTVSPRICRRGGRFVSLTSPSLLGVPVPSPEERNSYALASKIELSMVWMLGEQSRGVRDDRGFIVLKKARCPAVLVEVGYLSHPETEARLATEGYRQRIADAIARGILDFIHANTVSPLL